MEYTIKGKIIRIDDTQEFGANGFKKRTFVIDDGGQYPQQIPFEVVKDKCELLEQFSAGQDVEVHFDLRGRYWEKGDRYFPSLQAWKVTPLGDVAQTSTETYTEAKDDTDEPNTVGTNDDTGIDEEIPF